MLLFILKSRKMRHVTIQVSIHLMLLFILDSIGTINWSCTFQYISCYSLSHLPLSENRRDGSFNTSHVTLYQSTLRDLWQQKTSFNTSHVTLYRGNRRGQSPDRMEFQYISCYSLSKNAKADTDTKLRFNTSHVTLYRTSIFAYVIPSAVSIHLMLLFIKVRQGIL